MSILSVFDDIFLFIAGGRPETSSGMAEASVNLLCHSCRLRSPSAPSSELRCPNCDSSFVELLEDDSADSFGFSDITGADRPQSVTLDMLTSSLLNYGTIGGVLPPEDESGPDSTFFQISVVPQSNGGRSRSLNESSESSVDPTPPRRYNFRFGRQRRANTSNVTTGQTMTGQNNSLPQMTPNLLIEGLLQQLLTSANPQEGIPWGMFPLHGNPGDYAWGENGIDDIITQLLGQLDNSGAPPATSDVIEKLPKIKISQDHVDKKRDCSVCMDSFVIDDEAKELPCEHIFHPKCIDKWLELHNTCPICRTNVESQNSTCPRGSQHSATSSRPSASGGV